MKRLLAAMVLILLAACSSAAVPGAEGVLSQADKAKKTAVDTALQDAMRAEATYLSIHGSYTPDLNALANEVDYRPQQDVTITVSGSDQTSFCIQATHASLDGTWHVTPLIPDVTDGACGTVP
jgi:type II secretory pathway pseudopilin PulG